MKFLRMQECEKGSQLKKIYTARLTEKAIQTRCKLEVWEIPME